MQLAKYFISNAIYRHRDTFHVETETNSNESTSVRKIARFSSNILHKYEGGTIRTNREGKLRKTKRGKHAQNEAAGKRTTASEEIKQIGEIITAAMRIY